MLRWQGRQGQIEIELNGLIAASSGRNGNSESASHSAMNARSAESFAPDAKSMIATAHQAAVAFKAVRSEANPVPANPIGRGGAVNDHPANELRDNGPQGNAHSTVQDQLARETARALDLSAMSLRGLDLTGRVLTNRSAIIRSLTDPGLIDPDSTNPGLKERIQASLLAGISVALHVKANGRVKEGHVHRAKATISIARDLLIVVKRGHVTSDPAAGRSSRRAKVVRDRPSGTTRAQAGVQDQGRVCVGRSHSREASANPAKGSPASKAVPEVRVMATLAVAMHAAADNATAANAGLELLRAFQGLGSVARMNSAR